MIEDTDFTIQTLEEEAEPVIKAQRFPVLAQLSLLGLVLAIIFGVAFVPKVFLSKNIDTNKAAPSAPLVTAQDTLTNIPEIKDVRLEAKSAYVYDVRAKKALFIKSPDTVLPLASITKLMTALVAYELIDSKKTVTVPKSAIDQSGTSGLQEGEKITAQALSDYAILASSNDAAFALANAVGAVINKNNPNQTFVNAMNIRAGELGLPNLKFYNPTGLDESTTQAGAFGTAREISFLMEYVLLNHPNILEPSTFTNTKVYNQNGAFHEAENTNPIITKIPNLLGSKTGYTDLAGGNLTIAFDAGYNRPIIVTVLGSSYDGRFTDVVKLVNAVKESLAKNE